ncbi:MAG: transcriptional repressor [Clostridia bacterium]|nr:transcriptional repressor [Clostridia bacterium]
MKRNDYRTAGREALTGFLKQNPDCQFTVDELCTAVNGENSGGKSSIYRHLTELCQKDIVRKYHSEERNCNVYQYVGQGCDCRDHFHEKCVKCGKISHLDCHASADFISHLLREHGFSVNCGQSILYGVCADCMRGGASHA